MVRHALIWLPMGIAVALAAGCGESAAPASAVAAPPRAEAIEAVDSDLFDTIARASFHTSPPQHPDLAWPELARKIEAARAQLDTFTPLTRPAGPADPLAERIGSAQLRSLAQARGRALVLRAEAARLLAKGDADGAAEQLALMISLAREVSTWGAPATAETSAGILAGVLGAMELPDNAAMTMALTTQGKVALRDAFTRLDANDPAGRLRALTETIAERAAALRERASGQDGPIVVRGITSRYAPTSALATAQDIDRSVREAVAFARALGDGWDKPSRPAITLRLRQRQAEDATGVLIVLLGEAPDACDADARLRERIAAAMEGLP